MLQQSKALPSGKRGNSQTSWQKGEKDTEQIGPVQSPIEIKLKSQRQWRKLIKT